MSLRNNDGRNARDKQVCHKERETKGGTAAKLLVYVVGASLIGCSIWLWNRIFSSAI